MISQGQKVSIKRNKRNVSSQIIVILSRRDPLLKYYLGPDFNSGSQLGCSSSPEDMSSVWRRCGLLLVSLVILEEKNEDERGVKTISGNVPKAKLRRWYLRSCVDQRSLSRRVKPL